jgi:hypothetical protein
VAFGRGMLIPSCPEANYWCDKWEYSSKNGFPASYGGGGGEVVSPMESVS